MADAAALSFLLMSDERSSRLRRRYSDPCGREPGIDMKASSLMRICEYSVFVMLMRCISQCVKAKLYQLDS
jgi:hypothetical protein